MISNEPFLIIVLDGRDWTNIYRDSDGRYHCCYCKLIKDKLIYSSQEYQYSSQEYQLDDHCFYTKEIMTLYHHVVHHWDKYHKDEKHDENHPYFNALELILDFVFKEQNNNSLKPKKVKQRVKQRIEAF